MKAVGWTDRNVADLIVTEYVLQGLIGGGVGCALGYLTSYLYLMNSNLSIQSFSSYPACASSSLPTELTLSFHVSPLLVLIALGISAGIGVLAGYLASRRAARKQPAEALRST
jgi:ABC-type antimicrobial peptide transport system permease subunit